MPIQRLFRDAHGNQFWVNDNVPACTECDRFSLPCVSRVSGGGACFQCRERRSHCSLSKSKFCPRAVRGTGYVSGPNAVREMGPPSVSSSPLLSDSSRSARPSLSSTTPIALRTARAPATLSRPPRSSSSSRESPRTSPYRSPCTASRHRRSSSELTSGIENLVIPDPAPPVLLDITLPGPAREMSVADTLSVLSRTPSRSPSSAPSSMSALTRLSRTPSLPDTSEPPSPRVMRLRRLARLSQLREHTTFEESSMGDLLGGNPFDQ